MHGPMSWLPAMASIAPSRRLMAQPRAVRGLDPRRARRCTSNILPPTNALHQGIELRRKRRGRVRGRVNSGRGCAANLRMRSLTPKAKLGRCYRGSGIVAWWRSPEPYEAWTLGALDDARRTFSRQQTASTRESSCGANAEAESTQVGAAPPTYECVHRRPRRNSAAAIAAQEGLSRLRNRSLVAQPRAVRGLDPRRAAFSGRSAR